MLSKSSTVCTAVTTDIHTAAFFVTTPKQFFPAHMSSGEHALLNGYCNGVLSFSPLLPPIDVWNENDYIVKGGTANPPP